MDPILIIALVLCVVLLVALSAISLRRRRRNPKVPRAKGKHQDTPAAAAPLSPEDEQLLETLGGAKRKPVPSPTATTPTSAIPVPQPDEKPRLSVAPVSQLDEYPQWVARHGRAWQDSHPGGGRQ